MDLLSIWIRSERYMRVDKKMLKVSMKLLVCHLKHDYLLFEYTLNTLDRAMCQNLLSQRRSRRVSRVRTPEGALGTLFLAGKPRGAVFFCIIGKGLEPYGFVSPAGSVVASALCESRVVHRTTATQKAHKKQQINGKNLHLHKWENMVISNQKIFFPLIGGGKL